MVASTIKTVIGSSLIRAVFSGAAQDCGTDILAAQSNTSITTSDNQANDAADVLASCNVSSAWTHGYGAESTLRFFHISRYEESTAGAQALADWADICCRTMAQISEAHAASASYEITDPGKCGEQGKYYTATMAVLADATSDTSQSTLVCGGDLPANTTALTCDATKYRFPRGAYLTDAPPTACEAMATPCAICLATAANDVAKVKQCLAHYDRDSCDADADCVDTVDGNTFGGANMRWVNIPEELGGGADTTKKFCTSDTEADVDACELLHDFQTCLAADEDCKIQDTYPGTSIPTFTAACDDGDGCLTTDIVCSSPYDSGSDGLSAGAIAGIVIGSIVAVGVIGVVVWYAMSK